MKGIFTVRQDNHPTEPFSVGIEDGRRFHVSQRFATKTAARDDCRIMNAAMQSDDPYVQTIRKSLEALQEKQS